MMVVPTGKKLPAGTPLRVVVTEQLSLAVAVPKTVSLRSTAQFQELLKRSEEQFTAADEVYRSGGGPQVLGSEILAATS